MAEAAAKWSRLAGFSGWQWRVLLSAPWVLLATWVQLRRRGYRATLADAQPTRPRALESEAALQIGRETAFALAVAIKYGPWRPRCLLRSLALVQFLGRRGIACDVRIGLPAGQTGLAPGFPAHAWVEYDGVVLNDRDDVANRFTPFDAPAGKP